MAGSREVTPFHLILSLITIIGLDLVPYVVAQSEVPSENYTTNTVSHYLYALTSKGLSLYNLGNYTGAIQYYDRALSSNPFYVYALAGKGTASAEVK